MCDREEISLGLHAGEALTVIAARLGKATSTVSREVSGNGGRGGYRAWRAHRRARERARRPKVPKLACPRLAARVTGWLQEWWSPQEISAAEASNRAVPGHWEGDLERHEAPCNRAEVEEGLRRWAVAAG